MELWRLWITSTPSDTALKVPIEGMKLLVKSRVDMVAYISVWMGRSTDRDY